MPSVMASTRCRGRGRCRRRADRRPGWPGDRRRRAVMERATGRARPTGSTDGFATARVSLRRASRCPPGTTGPGRDPDDRRRGDRGTAVGGGDQRGGDFLPLRPFRGRNWTARWQRLRQAQDRLAVLPPIDVVKYADRYWVVDGHNRVALALYGGQLEIDAERDRARPARRPANRADPVARGIGRRLALVANRRERPSTKRRVVARRTAARFPGRAKR